MELGIIIKDDRSVIYDNSKIGNIKENRVASLKLLSYPEELSEFNKIIEFETDDGSVYDTITEEQYVFKNNITKYESVIAQIVFEDVETNRVWKSDIFELKCGKSIGGKNSIEEEKNDHTILDTIISDINTIKEKNKEFIITIIKDEDKSYSCDKNWEEIDNARELEKKLVLYSDFEYYYLSKSLDNFLEFAVTSAYNKLIKTFSLRKNNNEIEINFREIDLTIPKNTSDIFNDDYTVKDKQYNHTDNNYTDDEKDKLSLIENNAQVNKIEKIEVNGNNIVIDKNKKINLEIPTKLSELLNDNDTVEDSNYIHTDNNFANEDVNKLNQIENGAQINKIEKISINGVEQEITSNKEIDITIPTKVSELNNDSEYIDNNVNDLKNYYHKTETFSKNEINEHLKGYALKEEIPNVDEFITKSVRDLANYYLKTEIYTKEEVKDLISKVKTASIQKVSELPVIGENNVIYLVEKEGTQNDIHNEFIYINNAWEIIGSTQIDLAGYATENWVNLQIADFITEDEVNKLITNTLINYYTKNQINNLLDNKVDKEDGKSLVSDLEIARLQNVDNYDDTKIKNDMQNIINQLENMGIPNPNKVKVYGIKRKVRELDGTANSSSLWSRILEAKGLVAEATQNGTSAINDFDEIYPWAAIKTCEYDVVNDRVVHYIDEPEFTFNSEYEIYTEYPEFWVKREVVEEEDGVYEYRYIADKEQEGFIHVTKYYEGRYETYIDENNISHSRSGVIPTTTKTITSFQNSAKAIDDTHLITDIFRKFLLETLYLVEYANNNSQAMLGKGVVSSVSAKAIVAEQETNRIIITPTTNTNSGLYVGSTINLGTTGAGSTIAKSRRITNIEDYEEGDITGKTIYFDGDSVDIVVDNYINTSCAQQTGSCDGLGMKSGCYKSDSYHSVIYRGQENPFGNISKWLHGLNRQQTTGDIYTCPPEKYQEYSFNTFSEPYKKINYDIPTGNGYFKELGYDEQFPYIALPKASTNNTTGGSTTTYFCDFFQGGTSTNTVPYFGGSYGTSDYCGLFCWYVMHSANIASAFVGARLLKIPE